MDGKNNPEVSRTDREHPSASLVWLWLVLLFVLVLYPLSTGPVVRFASNRPSEQAYVAAIYKPIEVLYRNCRPAGAFFHWYIGIWARQPG